MDVWMSSEAGEPLHQIVVDFLAWRSLAHHEWLMGQIPEVDL